MLIIIVIIIVNIALGWGFYTGFPNIPPLIVKLLLLKLFLSFDSSFSSKLSWNFNSYSNTQTWSAFTFPHFPREFKVLFFILALFQNSTFSQFRLSPKFIQCFAHIPSEMILQPCSLHRESFDRLGEWVKEARMEVSQSSSSYSSSSLWSWSWSWSRDQREFSILGILVRISFIFSRSTTRNDFLKSWSRLQTWE